MQDSGSVGRKANWPTVLVEILGAQKSEVPAGPCHAWNLGPSCLDFGFNRPKTLFALTEWPPGPSSIVAYNL